MTPCFTRWASLHAERSTVRGLRTVRRRRNLICFSCLLVFAAAATVAQAQSAAPVVSAITFHDSPARGDTYERGERVQVEVRFDRAVKATGHPQVALTIGTQTRYATYASWGGLSLYFDYTVQETDRDDDGIGIAANALALDGGTITAADDTTDADLTHGAVAAAPGHKVDGSLASPPVVNSIFFDSPARGGTYELGETIELVFEFHRAVTVTGRPQVALSIGTQTRHAAYSMSWGGGRMVQFRYAVQEEDHDEDGFSIAANALLLNGGTITAADGSTDADLTHWAEAAGGERKVDGSLISPPAVKRLSFTSSPARGDTYELGESVEVVVEFDRVVSPAGRPQVALSIGEETRHATTWGWGSHPSLSFQYTVQATDRDADGIGIAASALILNGGTIKGPDGDTDADLAHPAVAAAGGHKVDGSLVSPPAVKSVFFTSSPARGGTFERGEEIGVFVLFDRTVSATGTARLALSIGEETRHATASGWGSSPALFFAYTVQDADRDEDGISIPANALSLNGGTIEGADGTTGADLTHAAPAPDRTRKVDGSRDVTPPRVRDISFRSSAARGDTYGLGETVEVVVEFDGAVHATGEPRLALTIGKRTRHAAHSGWSSHILYFDYTVQTGDRDEDGISIPANALSLDGGTITAADGTTEAVLTHAAVAPEGAGKVNGSDVTPPRVRSVYIPYSPARGDEDGISIAANALVHGGGTITAADGTTRADLMHPAVAAEGGNKVDASLIAAPGVSGIFFISTPARGDTYQLGEVIELQVEFDRAVTATGTPQVALTIGAQTRYAAYSESWEEERYAYFSYAVQEGDRDEDGISIPANALLRNGGTITAADGTTDADLTHAAVAPDRDRKVDGSSDVTPPRVTGLYFDSSPAKGDTYELGETVEVVVEFDGAVEATGEPLVALTIGTQTRHATWFGWVNHSLRFRYTVQVGDRDEDGISIAANALALNGGTITAPDGTTAAVLTHAETAAERDAKVNGSGVTPPRVSAVYFPYEPARGDIYELGETIEVDVEFDRAVTVTGNPQVALTVGTRTRYAAFSGWGSQNLYFNYTVQQGDRDEDGIGIPADALDLNGGAITAADGTTDADLSHSAVGAGGGRKVDGSLVTPPAVTDIYFVSSPVRGDTYGLGETIEVLVEFDRAVAVTGSPQVALIIGTQTRHAAYSTSWDTRFTFFSYAVQEADRDEDGISIAADALDLNGGTITAVDGTTDADLMHASVAAERGSKVNGSRVPP